MTHSQAILRSLLLVLATLALFCPAADARWERNRRSSGIIKPRPNAGRYDRTAWYAIPSNTRRFSGGYVGGGAVLLGEPRAAHEGTWGWDYDGALLNKRIWLNWWHGRFHQDGGGHYEPDGPKVLHRRER